MSRLIGYFGRGCLVLIPALLTIYALVALVQKADSWLGMTIPGLGLVLVLGQFFAVAEAYPTLKADEGFVRLQARISEIENQIADRREFYNDVVTTFNTRIQQVPDAMVANWLGFTPADLFKVAESDREDVEIRFAQAG